jgi:hypothetical protein
MTDARLPLAELLEKAGEGDFLRAVAEAVLLEQLMEVPAEGSAASEPGQGGTNDQPGPRRPKRDRGE